MTGLITQSAVLLLTRKRLERIKRLLQAKVRSAGTVNSTERQVLFLAKRALAALSAPPVPESGDDALDGSFTPWLVSGISMFATAGVVAIDFPQEAAGLAPGQQWLANTLRGGSGDAQRQWVFNRAARMLTSFADKVRDNIVSDTALDAATRATALAQMRAFAIGHASQIATLLVAAPYLDGIDAQLGQTADPAREKPLPAAVRLAIEAAVNQSVFGAAQANRPFWQGWLPAHEQLPDRLFGAYSFAAEDAYGVGARVSGSKAYNDQLAADKPPALSAQLLRDGYASYRALAQDRYGWTYGDWLQATLFMFLPSFLMLPFMALLPNGRDLRRSPAPPGLNTERAWFEALMFPFAANALAPLITTLRVMVAGYTGAGKETTFALVNAILGLVAAVVFFATLGADLPAAVRWPLLLIAPFIADLVLMIFIWSRGGGKNRHRQLAFGATMRLVLAAFFIVCYLSFTHLAIEDFRDNGFGGAKFWLLTAVWMVLVLGGWLGFTKLLMRGAPGADPAITGRPQNLLLFDQTTLRAQGAEDNAPLLFAGDREPVLKLWWTGTGELFIRPDRNALTFSTNLAGTAELQTVAVPMTPISASEFAQILTKAVVEPANAFTAKLRVERFDSAEPFDSPLPTGEVFADHGDNETTVEAHATEAAKFRQLPKTGDGYLLYLAPRARQAVRFGRNGELPDTSQDRAIAAADVPGNLLAIDVAGSVLVVGSAATRFVETFRVGDVIELPSIAQARVVVAVTDDQHLSVNLALAGVGPNALYLRRARDRGSDLPGPGLVQADPLVYRQLIGVNGAALEQMFMVGDVIEVQAPGGQSPERRSVTGIAGSAALSIDAPFSPILPPGGPAQLPYSRVGSVIQAGFDFVPPEPTALFGGNSLLDRAADLATLMSLGVSSRLLPEADLVAVPGNVESAHPAVAKAQHVFRDWNLNHRRVNEWRMLVQGQAFAEPGTLAAANQLGWAPLLARWLDMAHRPAVDSHADRRFRPEDPTNRELSAALADLLGIPAPA